MRRLPVEASCECGRAKQTRVLENASQLPSVSLFQEDTVAPEGRGQPRGPAQGRVGRPNWTELSEVSPLNYPRKLPPTLVLFPLLFQAAQRGPRGADRHQVHPLLSGLPTQGLTPAFTLQPLHTWPSGCSLSRLDTPQPLLTSSSWQKPSQRVTLQQRDPAQGQLHHLLHLKGTAVGMHGPARPARSSWSPPPPAASDKGMGHPQGDLTGESLPR